MKVIVSFLFVAVLFFESTFAGESTVSAGVSGGYSTPMHSSTFNFSNPEFSSMEYGQLRYSFGSGSGYTMAVNGVFMLDKTNRLSLASSVWYSNVSSKSDKAGESYPSRAPNGDTMRQETIYRNEYSQGTVSISFDLRYKVIESIGLGISAGISGSYITSSAYKFSFIAPGIERPFDPYPIDSIFLKLPIKDFAPRYTDDSFLGVLFYEGELPDINPLQISLRAGVFYDFAIKGVILSPSIVYHFPLTRISSSQEWKISQLVGSVDVRIPL